jgi:hypothetical protein
MEVAEPVAQAMGALHQIESSGGAALAQQAPIALDAVRRALASLQAQPQTAPAVNQAIEAVAGSLGLVHQLSQAAAAPPQQPPVTQASDMGMAATMYQPDNGPAAASPHGNLGVASTQPAQPGVVPAQGQPPGYGAHPQAGWEGPHYQQPQEPVPQQQAPQYQQPQQQPAPQYQQPQQEPPQAPTVASGPAISVDAELGAHSSTNFYKGLSGNDVIDSGGVFIATYQIPTIGQALLIKVSLPGGYEFEADGVVHWTRDAPHSTRGVESPPGYGARFTRISQEGRQLVYRYVRTREPLFYDDL